MSFRRGACPALSAPMLTGDGLLVRLATAGEAFQPAAALALCEAADRHGNGLVEITARGNFQIRGLTADSAAALASDIAALELGLRDGVPVETNPLAGLDPTATANAAPLARAIREAVDGTDLAARLAPKVSVVVDGGGMNGLSALSADVRITAVRNGKAEAWLISTGSDASAATPLGIAVNDAAAQAATLAILDVLAAKGSSARARDLAAAEFDGLSASLVSQRSLAPPSVLPDISPSGGEIGYRMDVRRSPAAQSRLRAGGRPISPLEGERSGRTEGGTSAEPMANDGPIPLSDGRFALCVALPFGSIRAIELTEFLDEARQHATELRFAPGRAALLLCNSEAAALAIRDIAEKAGLITSASDPRARIFACPGSTGCASGHIAAREIAAAVARELGDSEDADFQLHISGCPKGCAHPAPASLTLVGTEHGPLVVENGAARAGGIPFANQDIAARLASTIRDRANSQSRAETRRKPHPTHAFAGE